MYCNGMIEHEVETGDTLYKLSRQYKTTVSALILQNPRVNPYNLQIGMKLQICPGDEYLQDDGRNPGRPGSGNVERPGTGNAGMPGSGNIGMPGTGNVERPGTGNVGMPGTGNTGMPGIGNVERPGTGNMGMPGSGNVSMPGSGNTGMPGTGNMGSGRPGMEMPGTGSGNTQTGRPVNVSFADRMRMAWLNHVFLLNGFINSVVGDMPDQQEVAAALIRNAEEIADLFGRYYPQSEANQLQQLLMNHVELAGSYITETKAGNDARAENQKQRLYDNASQLARLLAGATPEFDERYLKDMLDMHIDLEGQALADRMAGEYERQIQTFRKAQQQAIAMADYFSDGLRREAEKSGL